jgi:Tfp pilus assembly protein PilX
MKYHNSKSKIINRGYTLLFAVLTASLVLGVAAFIANMARKQFILSSTTRDSLMAFNNADSAMSCIDASWDGATSTAESVQCNNSPAQGQDLRFNYTMDVPSGFSTNNDVSTVSALLSFGNDGRGCATFQIWKGPTTEDPPTEKTVIETRGYNMCTATGPSTSVRTVERAIRLTQTQL